MAHLARAGLLVTAVIGLTFLPFAPGGYDPLARPLSTMAWVLGRAGLVLVPIGLLWAWPPARHEDGIAPRFWLLWVTLSACAFIALVMILVAFASAGVLLASGTAATTALLILRLMRRLRAATHKGQPLPRMVPALLAVAPIVVVAGQTALVEPMTTFGRSRVIAHSTTLIAEIERYRARHGRYPDSLLAVSGDYRPSIVGVDRYHYEPSGEAYNVVFEEPSVTFGEERFVVYNPRDEQRMTSHAQDRLLLEGPELEVHRGHRAVHSLPQPHWKVFLFD